MIILECRNTSTFAAAIILTIQNALTKFIAVICDACINIVLIFIILEYVLLILELRHRIDFECLTYITETHRILTSNTAIDTISMTRTN